MPCASSPFVYSTQGTCSWTKNILVLRTIGSFSLSHFLLSVSLPSTNLVRGCFFLGFYHSYILKTFVLGCVAPDATQVGDHTITQKHLYTGLFVIGIPLFWWAGPFGTFFWLIGASSILVLGHASLLEPGIESDYATIQETVWKEVAKVPVHSLYYPNILPSSFVFQI
jgi:hypothetical protein